MPAALYPHLAAVAAALGAALCWGAGDFSGGLASRRASALKIIALAHGADVLALLAWIAFARTPRPESAALALGLLSGIINGFALAAFYLALASGSMGAAASLGGILTAAIPVLADIPLEGAPSAIHVAGFLCAALAIFLLTRQPHGHQATSRRAFLLACVAGIGFGIFLVISRQASRHALVWPLMASRVGSMSVALIGILAVRIRASATSQQERTSLGAQAFTLAMVAGGMDMIGNLLFMWSAQSGRLDIASVCASLYPAGTIALAAIFLKERFAAIQLAGMALSLVAVGLITA